MDNRLLNIQHKSQEFLCQKLLLKGKRRSKRAQIKESFCCQCGKIYLSFSALYLHAKNKHNFKLTTKLSDEVCRVDRVQGFVRYTFYIMEIENNNKGIIESNQEDSPYIQSPISEGSLSEGSLGPKQAEYFEEYIKNISSNQEAKKLKNFIKFALNQEKQSIRQLKQKIELFPTFLNNYVQQHLPSVEKVIINSEVWKNTCKILQKLCRWMFENKLTDLLVICDVE